MTSPPTTCAGCVRRSTSWRRAPDRRAARTVTNARARLDAEAPVRRGAVARDDRGLGGVRARDEPRVDDRSAVRGRARGGHTEADAVRLAWRDDPHGDLAALRPRDAARRS